MAALAGYLQAIINMIIKLGNLLIKITLQAFKDLWELLTDVSIYVFDGMLKVNLAIANAIPVPDFMHGGMQSVVNQIDPSIQYFLSQSNVGYALGIIGAGYSVSVTRRLISFGRL